MTTESEFASLKAHWLDAELIFEGGHPYVYLPKLIVASGGSTSTVSALLRPWSIGDGYATRLFFSQSFPQKGANWQQHTVLGRTWHTYSWSGVDASLPWLEIIASHLRPLQ
jgi:hypothetical protein